MTDDEIVGTVLAASNQNREATTGRELVAGTYEVPWLRKPEQRLAKPVNADAWKPGTALSSKVSQAGVGGAADVWSYLFHTEACPVNPDGTFACTTHTAECRTVNGKIDCTVHTHVGAKPPSWLLGRLGKTMLAHAREALRIHPDDPNVACHLVRAATNTPEIARQYAEAYEEACQTPPAPRSLGAATFDALDLLLNGVAWSYVCQALHDAAFAGHSNVSRAYEDAVRASRRDAARARQRPATQGQVLQDAYQRALAKQAALDAQSGAAA